MKQTIIESKRNCEECNYNFFFQKFKLAWILGPYELLSVSEVETDSTFRCSISSTKLYIIQSNPCVEKLQNLSSVLLSQRSLLKVPF